VKRAEVLERIRGAISPVLANLGYDLVEVSQVVSHGRRTLRVFINKPGGVNINDCARASKAVGPLLDEQDFLGRRYFLEVSSPGAERKLRTAEDFERFVGRTAQVRLRQECMGMTQIKGEIESFAEGVLRLRPDGTEAVTIPFEAISSANLCL
jgi:ribosome maturation factor RimP